MRQKGKQILALLLASVMLASGCADKTTDGEKRNDSEQTQSSENSQKQEETGRPEDSQKQEETQPGEDSEEQEPSRPWADPANIIKNPLFADGDAEWTVQAGDSTIRGAVSETPIVDDVTSYGIIERDPETSSSYDSFAQDITASVRPGYEYQFEFYAMLSDEYKDAPADQRMVEFAPYITIGGNTSYLGTYSSEISGNSSQSLTPGEWTKYSGIFKIPTGEQPEQVVIRIIEQGTNYGQGDCVKGDYCLAAFSMIELVKQGIETNLPNLKDYVASENGLGSDAIVGAAATYGEITDDAVYQLVTKHFNALTIGNELKPDATFGYSNDRCPGTVTMELNGKSVEMPKMDFSRGESVLNVILGWNEAHPDQKVRVRGHVLVWHSQTPEWFFHEDFDASKPYVTPEVMTERQECYIKAVLEHYHGKDSKYKDLFYAWDVVNEACSDGSGSYRTDKENSSWWAVYKSNEFIINAFKFANKYAPADVDLYYNDYNDTSTTKVKAICALLQAVKDAEGAPGVGTRIDGMGMQGHYGANDPTMPNLENAVRSYSAIVDQVQFTEVDIKAGNLYDGTAKTKDAEYVRMAKRYQLIYEKLKELDAEEGINISGFTFWGTVDKYSWLQSASDVGGGADGLKKQCPLLFDGNYKAKPSFWAFVDPTKIEESK